MRRVTPVLALAACLCLAIACDEKDNPAGSGDQTPAYPKTPAELITQYFPAVYSQMDSTAYAGLLDPSYLFELLPFSPDPTDPPAWWDLTEEMAIAGNMFSGRLNNDGQKVDRITLSMTVKTNLVDNTPYPNKPEGEAWHKVTAFVDLLVVVEDPRDPEGVINYVVSSDQIFTVRPDPSHDDGWIVYKQTDQEPINKTGDSEASTQSESWSGVKSLFR